jgi:hypothetical protein
MQDPDVTPANGIISLIGGGGFGGIVQLITGAPALIHGFAGVGLNVYKIRTPCIQFGGDLPKPVGSKNYSGVWVSVFSITIKNCAYQIDEKVSLTSNPSALTGSSPASIIQTHINPLQLDMTPNQTQPVYLTTIIQSKLPPDSLISISYYGRY